MRRVNEEYLRNYFSRPGGGFFAAARSLEVVHADVLRPVAVLTGLLRQRRSEVCFFLAAVTPWNTTLMCRVMNWKVPIRGLRRSASG